VFDPLEPPRPAASAVGKPLPPLLGVRFLPQPILVPAGDLTHIFQIIYFKFSKIFEVWYTFSNIRVYRRSTPGVSTQRADSRHPARLGHRLAGPTRTPGPAAPFGAGPSTPSAVPELL
jgi:hypothetical protein